MRVWRRAALVLAGVLVIGVAPVAHAGSGSARPWPKGLHGPFPLKSVTEVSITAHDGTTLQAWVGLPDLPNGVRAPAVVEVSPYMDYVDVRGSLVRDPATPVNLPGGSPVGFTSWWDENPSAGVRTRFGVPPVALVHAGYAVVFAVLRGTGGSGGCLDPGSVDEQRDQADTVGWIARQGWSNGRVGMMGLSFASLTTWEAATQAPPALKAVVTAGDLLDWYQFDHTPNGARSFFMADVFTPALRLELQHEGGSLRPGTAWVSHAGCTTEEQTYSASLAGSVTGDRDGSHYGPRNLMLKLPQVRAAVLNTEGYLDWAGHGWQGDPVWTGLPTSTPKIAYQGQWGHSFPYAENGWNTTFRLPSGTTDWPHILLAYLDTYLKDVGSVRTGVVYHQDQELTWHEFASWPPAPGKEEVLHPVGDALVRTPASSSQSFLAAQSPADLNWPITGSAGLGAPTLEPPGQGVEQSLCPAPSPVPDARSFTTAPVQAAALVAGNPFVSLDIRSDRPGGVVTATLWDLGPDFSCTAGSYSGARMVTTGAADLEFVHGGYVAQPFPTGRTTPVRIDLLNTTWRVEKGHRLTLVVSNGDFADRTATDVPTIEVVGTSDLVLPVMQGTLGGSPRAGKQYAPRPFVPPSYRD